MLTYLIDRVPGLEFHGSLVISNPPTQSNAQEDKDVFDSTGTLCNSYVPPVGQPGNLKGKSTPYACPIFSTTFAQTYHTYKIVWRAPLPTPRFSRTMSMQAAPSPLPLAGLIQQSRGRGGH